MVDSRLEQIRQKLMAEGNHSHTSYKFQNDLMVYAREFANRGNYIVEVGCFRGGLTSQFAYAARQLGQRLEVIDIDRGYLDCARETVKAVCEDDHVRYNQCDFLQFAANAGEDIRPSLVLIDGDHRYDGVVADIRALYSMKVRPASAAFHDFSLRYARQDMANVRVDRALLDVFGTDFSYLKIGEVAGVDRSLRTSPGQDTHYHEVGYPEGILIEPSFLTPTW